MDELPIIVVRGLGVGAVFSLVAMSFNVVHNSSGILNFAQGNLLVLGGLFGFLVLPKEPERGRAGWCCCRRRRCSAPRCWPPRATSRCCRCARPSSSIRG